MTQGVAEVRPDLDAFAPDRARSATGLLAQLNTPDLLSAADIHVARRLGRLSDCGDEQVLAAAALAVRAVRHGSVCLDLERVAELGVELWEPTGWREALLASPLVREAADDRVTPLVLDDSRLYLDRYWSEEGQVVSDVLERQRSAPAVADGLTASLDAYFPRALDGSDDYPDQRAAAEAACRNWLSVITGGPGTGKTTTVARLLGVLLDGDPSLRIALAAPTGRAAARLGEAVTEATTQRTFPDGHRERIARLPASTLHRLLGWQPGRRTFRHDRSNRLPYDVVVVDETSMVSLTMMARLLEAVRPQARLVLVGDAHQLASVDAGAVLGDLVDGLGTGSSQVSELSRSRRFGQRIGALAEAIRESRPDEALALLAHGSAGAVGTDADTVELIGRDQVEPILLEHAVRLREAAASGDVAAALRALEGHRLLCAHREGPSGAGWWNRRVERALAERERRPVGLGTWYVGRPLIVTENDYGLKLYNGDLGVVVAAGEDMGGMEAVISMGAAEDGRHLAVARLAEVRSAHAMTVHRSQGSQVREVTVLLPDDASELVNRQLLYTAVTRATERVRVVGSEAAVRAAVEKSAQRASGLAERLRGA